MRRRRRQRSAFFLSLLTKSHRTGVTRFLRFHQGFHKESLIGMRFFVRLHLAFCNIQMKMYVSVCVKIKNRTPLFTITVQFYRQPWTNAAGEGTRRNVFQWSVTGWLTDNWLTWSAVYLFRISSCFVMATAKNRLGDKCNLTHSLSDCLFPSLNRCRVLGDSCQVLSTPFGLVHLRICLEQCLVSDYVQEEGIIIQ